MAPVVWRAEPELLRVWVKCDLITVITPVGVVLGPLVLAPRGSEDGGL